MKKLAILLLTIFTIGTTALCGCGTAKENGNFENNAKNMENIQTLGDEENGSQDRECPECPDKPEFPDREKHGGKRPHPHPHRPHLHPDEKLPQPKTAKPQK
ncbi:MAG: hypothetical protein K2N23_07190 [Clostridia bacterium]|nr:hypothetical protein [Clostridia bacterium]